MDNPNTITLGGKEYPIDVLTLDQMTKAGPCFVRTGIDTVEAMHAQLTIIYHGMKAANPVLKFEEIGAIKGVTFQELTAAVMKIGSMCGLKMSTKDANAGEAKPVGDPAEQASQTGTGSASSLN